MNTIDAVAAAVVLGGVFAAGAFLLLSLMPRWSAPGLTRRIAPYIRDVTDPKGTSLPTLPAMPSVDLREVIRGLSLRIARLLGSSAVVELRLHQAAWRPDAVAFRGRQLVAAVIGVVVGGTIAVLAVVLARPSPAMWVLPVLGGILGVVACDLVLSRAAHIRMSRVEEELPTVLEFLSLCLSAGEGILDSLRRVAAAGRGELTAEFRRVVVAVDTGATLPDALGRMASDLDIPALRRAADQLTAAIERGAPLAHVLQAQAGDARESAKRTLIEQAGRKEIYMLLPLVFLILPLSVLFAVFPGIFMLRLGIG